MLETTNRDVEVSVEDSTPDVRPPLPEGLGRIELSDNGRTVLRKRYLRRGEDGQPIETAEEMLWRVAFHVAAAEKEWGGDVPAVARDFYGLLAAKRFLPNSPTFTGAGTPLGQLAACFVLPISDDMGRDSAGIFQTLRDAALIQQTGGGNGFSFSRLRHRGSVVHTSAGQATGPVGFLRVYDKAFGEIAQGGTRRGANMGVLRVDHPDIRDFISCKTDEDAITNFNISVGVTDEFMQAVKDDGTYNLVAPHTSEIIETVPAREIFELIVKHAHNNGEPGVLFLDTANRSNPLPHMYELEATNPCGEQFLGPYENCCLGSINLSQHVGPDKTVDWVKLRESVILATRFLDNVNTVNTYVPALPQLQEAAQRARRIGLGIMGLGDLMYHVGVRYGSEDAQEFAAQVMEFIRYHCILTSIELAKERGSFPAIEGSIYDPDNLDWNPPQPLSPYNEDYGRPLLDWSKVIDGIRNNGLRNAAQTTIAPTGTIATVAGCEGYGCEPVFALAYYRNVDDNGKNLRLTYISPLFEQAMIDAGLDDETLDQIIDQVMASGSCQDIDEIPEHIRDVFVVSQDISAEEHVRMQASLQAFVDNSLSKTINFPSNASEDDIARTYMLAWDLGCKGLTVYVTGSRKKVVLETQATVEGRMVPRAPAQLHMWLEGKKPRPARLEGSTYHVSTPLGKAFVTVNHNGTGQPFEVFITTAKAGSATAAVSEAIGRMISYILRVASPVSPRDRLAEVVRQLAGIGGGRPLGFGPNRVLSLPDGLAQALAAYLGDTPEIGAELISLHEDPSPMQIGDLCPECGAGAVVREEGCRKCYACGFSEC
ncbi:MAG: adenosylcobalamin-dependent ribonucleoside-diphosphate reductase [Anaerolineaceae bacterium]|nr:MAG: adenosylcobalamin-dependent ribonucleoside-diphosphate reductase [Anaerolineaceae bacterium]